MWGHDLDDYVAYLQAAGRAPTSVRLRRAQLERAFSWLTIPPLEATLEDLVAYLSVNPTWKPESRKSVRAALRSFYGWALDTERIAVDPSRKLPRITVPAGIPHPAPDVVLDRAIIDSDSELLLMLQLAAYAGLRRAEIARVHSDDVVADHLRVLGKGGRERLVPLHPILLTALRGRHGYLFPGKDDGHLSPDWVGRRMSAVLGPGWTAHSLRHRFATLAYAGQRDLLTVQQLLGHASVSTTQRYTQTPDDALRQAVLGVA